MKKSLHAAPSRDAARHGLMKIILSACACICMTSSGAVMAAEDSNYAAARAGIQKTLNNTIAAMKRGANVDEVAEILFTDDVVIAVPGTKAAPGVTMHGLKAFKPTLAEWIKEDIVSWTIEEPMKVSGNLAVAYIIGKVGPNDKNEPNTSYRALWVFENGPKGWRSSREAQVGSHSPDLRSK